MKGKGKGRGNNNKVHNYSLLSIDGDTLVICLLLVILLVLVVYYVRQNNEGFYGDKPKCDLYVFVADWCPHCKKAKPAVEELKNNAPANVNVNVVNEKDNNSRDLMNKYKVRGFPTILLVKADGEVVEFNERVSNENLNNFVANNAN